VLNLGLHVAVIGTGRVGRPTAYTLLCEGFIDELTVVDIKPGLAKAFAEELRHVAASLRLDVKINAYERDEDVSGADIVIVCAGYPRKPGVKISRRELITKNAEIIKYIAEVVPPNNPDAKYVIVTNPVDAMATLFKTISKADFVISTGTHLETLRFKARLALELGVPVSKISGYVGGEHGEAATILWSTVTVYGIPLDEYIKANNIKLDKNSIEYYVKKISSQIINAIGGTEYGPAAAFRDIVKAIALNRDEVLSIATPMKFSDIPIPVHVSIPIRVGMKLGPTLYEILSEDEKEGIRKAAKAVYETYKRAAKLVGMEAELT